MLITRLPDDPRANRDLAVHLEASYQRTRRGPLSNAQFRCHGHRYSVPDELVHILPMILREQFPLAPAGTHPALRIEQKSVVENRPPIMPFQRKIKFMSEGGALREIVQYDSTDSDPFPKSRESTFAWPTNEFALVDRHREPSPAFVGVHTRSKSPCERYKDDPSHVAIVFVAYPCIETRGMIYYRSPEDEVLDRAAERALAQVEMSLRFRLFGRREYEMSASITQATTGAPARAPQRRRHGKGLAILRRLFGSSNATLSH